MVVQKRKDEPPNWKALFAAAAAATAMAERHEAVKIINAEVDAIFGDEPPRSDKLFAALGLAQLSSCLSVMESDDSSVYRQLLALNDVIGGCDPRLAVTLAEQQCLNALLRLHERVANAASRVSQAVVMVLCTATLMSSGRPSTLEDIASRPALVQLVISQLIFLALNPVELLTPAGLGTAQRCVQVCWELTRTPAPHRTAFRELLVRIDMAGRLMALAAAATGRGPAVSPELDGAQATAATGEGSAAAVNGAMREAQAALSGVAALEGCRAGGVPDAGPETSASGAAIDAGTPVAVAPGSGKGDMLEERLALAAQSMSMVVNLAGLGNRGIELSASGLAPQRKWLLRPGALAALRLPLEGLVDGVAALRSRIEERGTGRVAQGSDAAALEAEDADLRPMALPLGRLLDQVEGAVRNVLMFLGLPTIVMGTSEEDVVEACGFVIRHCFGLYTEGYVDTMKALRAAVADPPSRIMVGRAAAAAASPYTEDYPGDYGPFFRAYAGHIEMIAPAIGVQLEDWGVRFTGEQAAKDLPTMEVGEGVDARIAHAWLKSQIQDIINWGHTMMTLVRMADQAKMAAHQLAMQKAQEQAQAQNPAQQQQGQAQGQEQAKPAAVPAVTAPASAPCTACGAAPQAGGPALMMCSRCRGVRYCSRACQVGHWSTHKVTCGQPQQAAAAAANGDGAGAKDAEAVPAAGAAKTETVAAQAEAAGSASAQESTAVARAGETEVAEPAAAAGEAAQASETAPADEVAVADAAELASTEAAAGAGAGAGEAPDVVAGAEPKEAGAERADSGADALEVPVPDDGPALEEPL